MEDFDGVVEDCPFITISYQSFIDDVPGARINRKSGFL